MSQVLATQADVGDRWRLGNHAASGADPFTALDVVTDPDAVTLTLLLPDRTELAWGWPTPTVDQAALTKESATTGRFYADYTWAHEGLHWLRLAGAGAAVAAVEFGVYVRPQRVP